MDSENAGEKCGAGLARLRPGAVEKLSPLETGTARRRLRDVGGVGKPEPRAGSWLWREARGPGKARRLARAGKLAEAMRLAKAGQLAKAMRLAEARELARARRLAGAARRCRTGSPASHTWRGPCLILPDTSASARTGTPASTLTPTAGIPGPPSARTAPRRTRRRCPRIRTRGHASVSKRPPRSRHPGTSDHGGSHRPGFLAVAHIPEHPLVTAGGTEVAMHPVPLGRPEAGA